MCSGTYLQSFRPDALFIPARTHPEVVIQAVAARDKGKAKQYADKHGIPVVLDSYEGKFFLCALWRR